ncbi:MAG: beta strand repeat-containing protein, partial [Verrucomicrobiota bacterium]
MKTPFKTVAIKSPTAFRTPVPVLRNSGRWIASALSLLCLGVLPDARAATITYTNAAVTAWTLPTSWNPNTTWGAVTNATVWGTNTVNLERRLHIGGLAGVTANATYSASEGVTTFDVSPAGGENRALLLATNNSGSAVLNITGGTLRCVASGVFNAEVLVGGGGGSSWNGSATFNVNGGIFDAATCDVDILPRGTNTPSAVFTVNSGTAIHGVTTFGNLGNINGPAELNLNGGTLVTSTIKLTSGRAINSAGSIAINLSGGELQAATNSTLLINGPSFALNGGTFAVNLTNSPSINTPGTVATTISAAMTGPGGFTKVGSGTLTLSADNSCNGSIQVNEGKLVTTGANVGGNYAVANGASLSISGTPSLNAIAIASGGAASLSGSPSVTGISVATGSTLSVSGAGSALSVGNLTNALNATNAFALGSGNPTVTPLSISGALVMNGNVVINVTGVGYTAGSYVLISYPPGSRSGAGSYVAGSLPLFGSIVDDTVNGQVLLNYSGNSLKLLSWTAGDGNFDFVTPNWQNTVTASPDTFANGDYVTFGDLGGGGVITVTADTAASPGQIVINNNFPDYHFQGSVGLGGTSGLTKIGSRPAYLDGPNSYSGPTLVGVTGSGSDSVLVVNHGGALGAGGAGNETIVSNTATLLLAGGITVPSENISLSGGGFSISGGTFGAASRGALQSLSGSNVWNGTVALLASGSRIGCQDTASLTINGVISGNFACVLRPGVDSTIRLNQQNTWAGNSQLFGSVVGGVTTSTILLGTDNALPALRLLHSNCRLDLNGFNQLVDGIAANGGTGTASFILNNGATLSTLTLSNTADASWDGLIQDGSAALALVKAGTAQQSLAGSNSFSGGTLVSSGILELQNASAAGVGAIADNSTLVLNLGGTVANAISGTGAVIKMGTGTAILSGASSYTGPTTVSNGTLHVTTAQTGAGSFIVADARTLGIDLHANGGS